MNPKVLELIQQLLVLALQYGPGLTSQVKTALRLAQQDGPLSPEQMAEIEQALDDTNNRLLAAITKRALEG